MTSTIVGMVFLISDKHDMKKLNKRREKKEVIICVVVLVG